MVKNFLYRVEKLLASRNRLDRHVNYTGVKLTARVELHLIVMKYLYEEIADLLKYVLLTLILGIEKLID